jgi:hypothetical protein
MKKLLLALATGAAAVGVYAGLAAAAVTVTTNPNPVAPGNDVTFSGSVGEEGAGRWVAIYLFDDAACTATGGHAFAVENVQADETGAFSITDFVPIDFPAGTYYMQVWVALGESSDASPGPCVPWSVGTAGGGSTPVENNVFLCYSAYQTDPAVYSSSQAAQLLKQGYWAPYAVPNKVVGGTNVGGFHLVCNIAASQAVSGDLVGDDGTVFGSAFQGVPGLYPRVGS